VALLEFIARAKAEGKKDITLQNIWMEEIGPPAVETNSKNKNTIFIYMMGNKKTVLVKKSITMQLQAYGLQCCLI
jgi:hypothetical protein